MSWTLLGGLVFVLGIALLSVAARRSELTRMRRAVRDRDRAQRQGSDGAQLLQPVVDLTRCLGCGKCADVCPEDGVLELVHGQAMVVNGARCVGHALCERECPVGAITVTVANLQERRDIPALTEDLEAVGSPGLFLAGELTAHALIKAAIEQGAAVGAEVARRVRETGPSSNGTLDLVVVGAGPAGLACSLEAKRNGLRFATIDQEAHVGGTVAKYPRRKLVMSQPVEMPLLGRFGRTTYTKEEVIDLWSGIAREHDLPIRGGEVFTGLERRDDGAYVVRTEKGAYEARHVCLALGRRGTPRRLGIKGEDLPKVAYSLLDAHSYQGRRILVVGGGDSAVETAVALAEQPGNEVTISYRKESFFRIRSRNEERVEACVAKNRLRVLFESELVAVLPDRVELEVRDGSGTRTKTLPNDEVFVMAGGTPPFRLLESAGVSFDPDRRAAAEPIGEQGSGLVRALGFGFAVSLAALLFAAWHADYYGVPLAERATHPKHAFLRPGMGAGLWLGIAASAMIVLNLAYLLRRAGRLLRIGSLRLWMTFHVATGILALLCALLHGAMAPRDTVGGYAFWALVVLLATGAIGRYFYAFVPRAANGRELELAEVKARLGRLADEPDPARRRFRERAHAEVAALADLKQWGASFPRRVLSLLGARRDLSRVLARISREGREEGVPDEQVRETLQLARTAHRAALMAAHYEDLRSILNTWRYLHRWVAALLVLLVLVHVAYALAYGSLLPGGAG
jgi:thioredoxin reductase/Pyruvate/2-oxoacid:ferredoxin oxidoreductase delta subunit